MGGQVQVEAHGFGICLRTVVLPGESPRASADRLVLAEDRRRRALHNAWLRGQDMTRTSDAPPIALSLGSLNVLLPLLSSIRISQLSLPEISQADHRARHQAQTKPDPPQRIARQNHSPETVGVIQPGLAISSSLSPRVCLCFHRRAAVPVFVDL